MKRFRSPIIFGLAIVTLFFGVVASNVFADDSIMTDQQIALIRSNCSSVKVTLSQLHSSDALLRVNRGQVYESMATKLMEKFNNRIAGNNLNNTDLVAETEAYQSALSAFRADYITYEQQLSVAIDMDCSKQPVSFYDAIDAARTARGQVHADVLRLNQQIIQYQSAIDRFGVYLQGIR